MANEFINRKELIEWLEIHAKISVNEAKKYANYPHLKRAFLDRARTYNFIAEQIDRHFT